jgi:hypothetical protein
MATTKTPRLNLAKQAAGDNPGSWQVDLNTGFDDADARFFRTGTDDPNTAETADFIGQKYYESDIKLWWRATVTGSSGRWVRDGDEIDGVITHPSAPTTLAEDYPHGHLNAIYERLSDTEVQLETLGGDTGYADISGGRETWSGPFIFDITTDLEGAQTEDPSTWYYAYLDNLTTPGTLLPVVSKTAPDDIAGTKPLYHPTLADHRYVGSFFNNASSHIQKFIVTPGGLILFGPTIDAAFKHKFTPVAAQADYRSQALSLPRTAQSAKLMAILDGDGGQTYMAIAQSDAAVASLPAANPPQFLSTAAFDNAAAIMNVGTADYDSLELELAIANRASPAFKYGTNNASGADNFEVVLRGYRDLGIPRGY